MSLGSSAARTFLQELVGDLTAIRRISVITRVCFSWPFTPFFVMVKSKILESSNYLMNSCVVTGHVFANQKTLPVQNYNLGTLASDKLAYFAQFLIDKNYEKIEKTAQIFFNQARTELLYCSAHLARLMQ